VSEGTLEEGAVGAMPDTAGLATDLAIEEARSDPIYRAKVGTFFDKQIHLAGIQEHHLREQFKQLRLTLWEKRFSVLLRAGTAFMGFTVAGFVAWLLWSAAHADGLVIESFSVPPEMAQRGLNGQVVAGQLLDELSGMQRATVSNRPAKSYGKAKNQSYLAVQRFDEANKFAPHWGRLHLKWGEALVYAGKEDEAKAQFSRAAQLDLTPSEKLELAHHP
jgi:hypothetical protein